MCSGWVCGLWVNPKSLEEGDNELKEWKKQEADGADNGRAQKQESQGEGAGQEQVLTLTFLSTFTIKDR